MNESRYSNAYQFFAGYFHQDFSREFSQPEDAVEKFIAENPKTMRALALKDLRDILAQYDGEALDGLILELGCYYSPMKHRRVPTAQWLSGVAEMLENSLSN
jgi:hypothetical protein